MPNMFDDEINIDFIGQRIIELLIITTVLCLFSMAVTYIAIIRGKNNQLIEENLKLLDKMHEGLIVDTEKDLAIKFANKPARRLLK